MWPLKNFRNKKEKGMQDRRSPSDTPSTSSFLESGSLEEHVQRDFLPAPSQLISQEQSMTLLTSQNIPTPLNTVALNDDSFKKAANEIQKTEPEIRVISSWRCIFTCLVIAFGYLLLGIELHGSLIAQKQYSLYLMHFPQVLLLSSFLRNSLVVSDNTEASDAIINELREFSLTPGYQSGPESDYGINAKSRGSITFDEVLGNLKDSKLSSYRDVIPMITEPLLPPSNARTWPLESDSPLSVWNIWCIFLAIPWGVTILAFFIPALSKRLDLLMTQRRNLILCGSLTVFGYVLLGVSPFFIVQSLFTQNGSIDGTLNFSASVFCNFLALFSFLTARCFLSISSGFIFTNAAAMIASLASPRARGKLIAAAVFLITFGFILASATPCAIDAILELLAETSEGEDKTKPTVKKMNMPYSDVLGYIPTNRLSWLLRNLVYAVLFVAWFVLLLLFVPESPRALLRSKKSKEAAAVLQRMRSNAQPESISVELLELLREPLDYCHQSASFCSEAQNPVDATKALVLNQGHFSSFNTQPNLRTSDQAAENESGISALRTHVETSVHQFQNDSIENNPGDHLAPLASEFSEDPHRKQEQQLQSGKQLKINSTLPSLSELNGDSDQSTEIGSGENKDGCLFDRHHFGPAADVQTKDKLLQYYNQTYLNLSGKMGISWLELTKNDILRNLSACMLLHVLLHWATHAPMRIFLNRSTLRIPDEEAGIRPLDFFLSMVSFASLAITSALFFAGASRKAALVIPAAAIAAILGGLRVGVDFSQAYRVSLFTSSILTHAVAEFAIPPLTLACLGALSLYQAEIIPLPLYAKFNAAVMGAYYFSLIFAEFAFNGVLMSWGSYVAPLLAPVAAVSLAFFGYLLLKPTSGKSLALIHRRCDREAVSKKSGIPAILAEWGISPGYIQTQIIQTQSQSHQQNASESQTQYGQRPVLPDAEMHAARLPISPHASLADLSIYSSDESGYSHSMSSRRSSTVGSVDSIESHIGSELSHAAEASSPCFYDAVDPDTGNQQLDLQCE